MEESYQPQKIPWVYFVVNLSPGPVPTTIALFSVPIIVVVQMLCRV